jgi:hypothetical protein
MLSSTISETPFSRGLQVSDSSVLKKATPEDHCFRCSSRGMDLPPETTEQSIYCNKNSSGIPPTVLFVRFGEARCIQFTPAIAMQLNLNATTQQLHCLAHFFFELGETPTPLQSPNRAGVKKTEYRVHKSL